MHAVLNKYVAFKEQTIKTRVFKHDTVTSLLEKLPAEFVVSKIGISCEERPIYLTRWGNGPVTVLLWSQMHGDEPTGTMALFDLMNFLQQKSFVQLAEEISEACTIYMLPMLNPDGAEMYTRRNAQQIDINRDYLATNTPEGSLLKTLRNTINPDFGFNLHDQTTLWSVKGSLLPATISYLAPAADEQLTITKNRKRAMQVIAEMHRAVAPFLPGQVGLFDESYEQRAFGDNFQKAGTSTILIEAGGLHNDPEKQEIRKFFFLSLLTGLKSIAEGSYSQQSLDDYKTIPPNDKRLYHTIIHNVSVNGVLCSIALNYEEALSSCRQFLAQTWSVHDLGDLTGWNAYNVYNKEKYILKGPIQVDEKADFSILTNDGQTILTFENGILVHSSPQAN